MEKKIADLEAIIKELSKNKDYNHKQIDSDDGTLKPLHSKDMKPPPEFSGSKMEFVAWHESFTCMLKMKTTKWMKVVDWIKHRREKRIPSNNVKAEYDKLGLTNPALFDKYVSENLEVFQRHLYRYLLDFTK